MLDSMPWFEAALNALRTPWGAVLFVPLYALWVTLLLPGAARLLVISELAVWGFLAPPMPPVMPQPLRPPPSLPPPSAPYNNVSTTTIDNP